MVKNNLTSSERDENLRDRGNSRRGVLFFVSAAVLVILASFAGALAAEAVKNYGDRVEVELSPGEQAAVATLAEMNGGRDGNSLILDKRCVLVARDLAGEIKQDMSRQKQILSSDHVSALSVKYGIYDTSVRCQGLTYGTDDDIRAQVRFRFASGKPIYTHMGAGVAAPVGGQAGVAVIILADRRVELSAFPRKVKLPSSWTLSGKLVSSSVGGRPEILLTPPSGEVDSLPVSVGGNSFSSSIPFNQGAGIYRIEVVAKGVGFSHVAALLEVEAGLGGNSSVATFEISGFDNAPLDESEAENFMVEMINQVRAKEGLNPLSDDPLLKNLAREHSADMMKNQYVGHISPQSGSLQRRVIAAGLEGFGIRENVALDTSLVHAMNNLLKSPVHRASIIAPEINSAGVGISFDDSSGTRHYYITQEFARLR